MQSAIAEVERVLAERDALREEIECDGGSKLARIRELEAKLAEAQSEVAKWKRISYAETKGNACVWRERCEKAEAALRELWQWSDPMDLPRFVVELVRAAPSGTALEKHEKHPTGDYCIYCRAQWPCEEAEPKGGA